MRHTPNADQILLFPCFCMFSQDCDAKTMQTSWASTLGKWCTKSYNKLVKTRNCVNFQKFCKLYKSLFLNLYHTLDHEQPYKKGSTSSIWKIQKNINP